MELLKLRSEQNVKECNPRSIGAGATKDHDSTKSKAQKTLYLNSSTLHLKFPTLLKFTFCTSKVLLVF